MNQHALDELMKAALFISLEPPLRYIGKGLRFRCVYCHTEFDAFYQDARDESIHAEDCPWRILKESLANLDNEGY